jgi:hypothetical protein
MHMQTMFQLGKHSRRCSELIPVCLVGRSVHSNALLWCKYLFQPQLSFAVSRYETLKYSLTECKQFWEIFHILCAAIRNQIRPSFWPEILPRRLFGHSTCVACKIGHQERPTFQILDRIQVLGVGSWSCC